MMPSMRTLLPAALYVFGALGCQTSKGASGAGAERSAARPVEMPASTYLPDAARHKIRATMRAHGDDMTMLMWSIMFLDVDGSAEFARVIQRQPWLERPADPASVPVQERVPEIIYQLQDQLKARASTLAALADASGRTESARLAKAFGDMAQTCVSCHAAYLYEDSAQAAGGGAPKGSATP